MHDLEPSVAEESDKLSLEEELIKSIKKVKWAVGFTENSPRKIVSYRDTLVGADFADFEACLEQEPVSTDDMDTSILESVDDGYCFHHPFSGWKI